ncbi:MULTISPECIES: type IV toxin-antitoxin system AbiEi family antitoxin domain-containing protein [unclassified Frondihabitans]|uniref:type IV toxin-antitoxin system AbiEi family antitoxin domain-containing protein n=1 Tax=unclassified Frondihabitans TaxID=2626248 RepID=UPI000F4D83B5|nr:MULTISPECIES: type IV toxin-antitoxin system AbiEi family antitoxin domain-containing protein [unclassified Frondihabitans]RPE77400.1 hypothetical protein EDF37_0044 [Frondihabitans sp. PhB153]RPF07676.1 hypothetical protein EDF39_0044 [Frondihabitans sp. PhB161]
MNRLEGATEIVRSGVDDRATRRAVERGLLVRLARGCHVRAVDWSAADRDERFRLRIQAARLVTRGRFVLSHAAAAYAWGLPWVGDWPRLVDVTDPERSTTRSTTVTRCHAAALEESETVSFDGFLLTSLARTVIDVALTVPFSLGVVVADAALNSGHVVEGQFTAALDSRSAARRFVSATHVVRFADRLAGSAAESLSRVGVHARGAPRPLLQKKFHGSHGATAFGDLFWEQVGVLGECDGDQKYLQPKFRPERSVEQALLEEKRRGDWLQALPEVRRLVRWGWREASDPELLSRRLAQVGVPFGPRRRPGDPW